MVGVYMVYKHRNFILGLSSGPEKWCWFNEALHYWNRNIWFYAVNVRVYLLFWWCLGVFKRWRTWRYFTMARLSIWNDAICFHYFSWTSSSIFIDVCMEFTSCMEITRCQKNRIMGLNFLTNKFIINYYQTWFFIKPVMGFSFVPSVEDWDEVVSLFRLRYSSYPWYYVFAIRIVICPHEANSQCR